MSVKITAASITPNPVATSEQFILSVDVMQSTWEWLTGYTWGSVESRTWNDIENGEITS